MFSEFEESNQGKVAFGDKKAWKDHRVGKVYQNPSDYIKNVYLVDGPKLNLLNIS